MAGTVAGGRAAAKTNRERYGRDFYSKIGAKGGKLGRTGGFASKRECVDEFCEVKGRHLLASCAGMKGGRLSRRPRGTYNHRHRTSIGGYSG